MRSVIVSSSQPTRCFPSRVDNTGEDDDKKAYRPRRHPPSCSLFFSNIILARSLGNPRSVPDQATSRTFYKSARIRVHSFLPDQNVIRVLRWLLDDGTD